MLATVDFKQRLKSGEAVFGSFVQIPSPAVIEILGLAGFDFLIFDQEHGILSLTDVEAGVRTCVGLSIAPLVRLRANALNITATLDTGVSGIHVPRVNSPETARSIVEAARFYPLGTRGLNPMVRAASYSHEPVQEFVERSNREIVIAICIEGVAELEQIEEIVCIPGIDVVFVGPYDMSQSLGMPGNVTDPAVLKVLGGAIDRITSHGVVAGIFAGSVESARYWIERGARYIVYCGDTMLLLEIAKQKMEELRTLMAVPAATRTSCR